MYQSLEAKLHDVFWNAEAPDVELDFLKEYLKNNPGKTLEIGCGSGRVLLPLNAEGFHVDGNDVSKDMLDLIQEKPEGVELFHGTTLEQDISQYKNIIVPAFTFMLMSEGELKNTLAYIFEKTSHEATIYFTLFIPWAEICGELDEARWYDDHDAQHPDRSKASCRTRYTIDRTQQILTRKHKYKLNKPDKSVESHDSEQVLRWYYLKEMNLLLDACGWKPNKMIYDFDPSAKGENAHLLTFFCNKK